MRVVSVSVCHYIPCYIFHASVVGAYFAIFIAKQFTLSTFTVIMTSMAFVFLAGLMKLQCMTVCLDSLCFLKQTPQYCICDDC